MMVWALVGEGAILGTALALWFGHGVWLRWHRARTGPVLARARATLAEALENGQLSSLNLQLLETLPFQLKIKLFSDVAPSLGGTQRRWLTTLAEELGLIAKAERLCLSRFWWRRLEGARLLTLLGGRAEATKPLLQDPHLMVRVPAIEWAADHPTPDLAIALLALLDDPSGLNRLAVQDGLLRMGSIAVDPLAEYLGSHSGQQVVPALEVAVGLAAQPFLGPALELCEDESPKVRALVATLLGVLGGIQGVSKLPTFLQDPDPRVREAAARATGKLGFWPSAPRLATLLRDPVWEVRRESGLALRALGSPGSLVLRRALSDLDPFACDIARQVLDLPDPAGLATKR